MAIMTQTGRPLLPLGTCAHGGTDLQSSLQKLLFFIQFEAVLQGLQMPKHGFTEEELSLCGHQLVVQRADRKATVVCAYTQILFIDSLFSFFLT